MALDMKSGNSATQATAPKAQYGIDDILGAKGALRNAIEYANDVLKAGGDPSRLRRWQGPHTNLEGAQALVKKAQQDYDTVFETYIAEALAAPERREEIWRALLDHHDEYQTRYENQSKMMNPLYSQSYLVESMAIFKGLGARLVFGGYELPPRDKWPATYGNYYPTVEKLGEQLIAARDEKACVSANQAAFDALQQKHATELQTLKKQHTAGSWSVMATPYFSSQIGHTYIIDVTNIYSTKYTMPWHVRDKLDPYIKEHQALLSAQASEFKGASEATFPQLQQKHALQLAELQARYPQVSATLGYNAWASPEWHYRIEAVVSVTEIPKGKEGEPVWAHYRSFQQAHPALVAKQEKEYQDLLAQCKTQQAEANAKSTAAAGTAATGSAAAETSTATATQQPLASIKGALAHTAIASFGTSDAKMATAATAAAPAALSAAAEPSSTPSSTL